MYRHLNNGWNYSLASASELIRQAMAASLELRQDSDTLPGIEPDGTSQCSFSEQMFFDKERTALFVRDDLRELKKFLKDSTDRIASLESRVSGLAHEREELNGKPAQDKLAEAEVSLLSQLRDHQRVRRELLETISEVEATLREADARRFPGGDPRGQFGQRVYSEPQVPRPLDEITRDNARDEIGRIKRISQNL